MIDLIPYLWDKSYVIDLIDLSNIVQSSEVSVKSVTQTLTKEIK